MKIMVVDDCLRSCKQISEQVSSLPKFKFMGMLHDGHELIKCCYQQKILPDIVLLDVHMPKMDGITTMNFMGEFFPAIKVIAVSAYTEADIISAMLAGGAWGYLFKHNSMNVLQEALMAIVANQPYVDDLLKYDVANRENLIRKRKLAKNQLFQEYSFNTREREVMGLVVSSISYQTIGEILNISPKTVETITHSLAKKIGVSNNRPELVLQSLRLGITKMMQKID